MSSGVRPNALQNSVARWRGVIGIFWRFVFATSRCRSFGVDTPRPRSDATPNRHPMTPEEEAEAIRLCEDILDQLNQIAAVLEAFLATPPPDFSSLQTLRSGR